MNILYFSGDWKEYSYKPLRGTFAAPIKVDSVEIYEPLVNLDYSIKTVFLCHDGLHAVASGSYQSSDKYFVDWGPLPNNQKEIAREINAGRIVICDNRKFEVEAKSKELRKNISYFREIKNGDTYRSLAILEGYKN